MTTEQMLVSKFMALPENGKHELLDFLDFLMTKKIPEKKKSKKAGRRAGFAKGTFVMSADFDAPLEDFKEYM